MSIPLDSAYLCPECDVITDSATACPKCLGTNLLALAGVLNRSAGGPNDWPECEEFYNLMQYYRHFPLELGPVGAKDAYEAVKDWLRRHRERN